jgi:hypothetical protein
MEIIPIILIVMVCMALLLGYPVAFTPSISLTLIYLKRFP